MHRRVFLVAGLAAGLSTTAHAANKAAEPVSNEGFTGFGSAGAIPLERQSAVIRGEQRGAMGFGGQRVFYELARPASPVRFKADAVPSFVVNAPADIDPQTRYGLFRLEVVGTTRRLMTGRSLPQGVGTIDILDQRKVAFTASRYGADFFKLDPATPLQPGEYALVITENLGTAIFAEGGKKGAWAQGVFAFGVD